ncbi:DMT family transporter [Tepidibacter aestuarii]|uniref:DMT family transporter n=1 Tax=Tepidibacter aestuarii TaxID=2925782 RepID=UPI0020BFEA6B|nr:DMT family transporter [Tepidibacter aestuarii]CAH2212161.1 Permease of the drug/metabolite transporter (DMT) superfamily [Tepidibacter aestuarii]
MGKVEKMKNSILLSKISIMFSVIIWGVAIVSLKVIVTYFPPMTANFIRFSLASIILIILLRVLEPKSKIDKKDLLIILKTGALGISVYYYFESLGLLYVDASTAGLISGTIPIMTLFVDSIVNKKRLSTIDIFIFSLSTTGIFLIVYGNLEFKYGISQLYGYIFMVIGCFSWVIYTIFTKKLEKKYSSLSLITYQSIAGSICLAPSLLIEKFNLISWIKEGNNIQLVILNLLFLSIFGSAIAYYLYLYGFRKIGASRSSLYMNLIPVVSLLAGVFILNESIGLNKILGAVFIITSVLISDNKKLENLKYRFIVKKV